NEASERLAQIGDVLIEFAARLDHELGSCGGSGSANVSDKIGDGEIGFMAHAGDDGNFGSSDGAGERFFVEGPKIFHGTAATRKNQNVHKFFLIEEFQRFDDFRGGAFALDAHRKNRQVHIVKAAAQDADDVADGGSPRRGDQAHGAGGGPERVFSRGREQALRFEAFLQLLEGELQRAETNGLDILDVNLVF